VLANVCFFTIDTNLNISDCLLKEYFPKIENTHPGALAPKWIAIDPTLWRTNNLGGFFEAPKATWPLRRT